MLLNLWTLILLRGEKHTQFPFHAALNAQAEEHTCWAEGVALDSISFYSNPKYTWISAQVENTSVSTRIALIAIVLIMGSQSGIRLNSSSISAWRKRVGVLLLSIQRAPTGCSRTPVGHWCSFITDGTSQSADGILLFPGRADHLQQWGGERQDLQLTCNSESQNGLVWKGP